MNAHVIEMTPHTLQSAGVVPEGHQYHDSTAVVPVASMFAGLTKPERELAVTGLIQTASGMLKQAIESGEPAEALSGYKDQAAAIADLTKRLDVSKDAVLDAQVLQRRAERGLGQAIRYGQAQGVIAKPGDIGSDAGLKSSPRSSRREDLVKVSEFLRTGSDVADTYAMTDGVTDERFDGVIEMAREEGNVSRANVVRKLKNAASERDAREERRVGRPTDTDARAWHANLAVKYPLPRFAFEAEGRERHATLSAFQDAATRYGAKYRFHEKSYAKHVSTSQDRLFRASLSLESAIGVFEHIDLETITKEQAEDALQRIDTRAFNLIIRSLKDITK